MVGYKPNVSVSMQYKSNISSWIYSSPMIDELKRQDEFLRQIMASK